MKLKYIVTILWILIGTQIILGKGFDHNLLTPESSAGTNHVQKNVDLIAGYSYSPEAAEISSSLEATATIGTITYNNPAIDPTSRTVNTSYLVGTTKGAISVNQAGEANYAIPIDVLPGANGLAPSLSLVYSSNSGSGVAGYGWQIGGISVVGRAGQNYYNDVAARGVELDYNDKFTLDGQRLVLTSGTYGYDLATYQTEIDEFTRVQSQLVSGYGPLKFLSQTKSGLKNLYGVNADARQVITGYSEVLNWYISQTTDLYGNLISYTYLNDNSVIYPSDITYGPNKVTFSYTDRADITSSYFKGKTIQQRYLLDKVTVTYNSNVVKVYEMKYNKITDDYNSYSALNEVIEYGTGGSRLNSTAFSYQTPANVSMSQTTYNTYDTYITYKSKLCSGDFNGDGKGDFLCLPDATKGAAWTGMKVCYSDGSDNFTTTLAISTTIDLTKLDDIQALDINGDGKDDILYELVTAGTSTFYYMLNNGTSFGSPVTITSMTNGTKTGMNGKSRRKNNKQENDNQLSGTDYDGDGINDIFLNDPSGNWKIYSLGNSSGVLTVAMILRASGTLATLNDQTLSGDFNGDGKTDIWGFDATGVKIYNFIGSALSSLCTSTVTSKNHFFTLGDFNSDGKVDIFIYGFLSGSTEIDWTTWQVQLSIGNGFQLVNISQKKPNLKNDYVRLGDFNGDGCTDVMVNSLNQSWAGSYFYITKNKGTDFSTINLPGFPAELNNFNLADYNGDGRTDFISTDGITPWWNGYKLYKSIGNTTPLLEKIGDGINNLTTIVYTKLSQAGAFTYMQGSTIPTFPVYNYQGSMPIVMAVYSDNGIGGNTAYSYGYEGAKIHRQGKGFLCFSKINMIDVDAVSHTETVSGYDPVYYYPQITAITKTADQNPMIVVNPPETEQLSVIIDSPTGTAAVIPGTTLETATNTWDKLTLDATTKRIYPYVKSSTQTNALTGNFITNSISTIDNYGNPTRLVKSFGNGVSETTNISYTNTINSTDWKLGRVDNSTVTYAKSGETSVSHALRFTYSADGILKPDFIYYNENTPLAYYKNHDYDSKGNLTQLYISGTSIGSSQINYTYDTNGIRVLTSTDVLGHVTTNTYDTSGRLLTERDYLTNTNTYGYDAMSRQTLVSGTIGSQITTAYLWAGSDKPSSGVFGITRTGNEGSVSITWYDRLQREVRRGKKGFGGQFILTDSEYDYLGQIYRVSDPYFSGGTLLWAETYVYVYARLTGITRRTGRNTTFAYSGIRATETTGGKVTWKETDSQGLITTAHDAGGDILYAYFPDGRVKTITAPGGVVTSMQYADAARNKTQMIDPSAGTINYTYDSFGRIKTQTDARIKLTTYIYFPDGRIDNVVSTEGTTTYTYNPNKQLTGISSPNSVSRSYGYDTKGRVNSIGENIAGTNFPTIFTYDTYGRLGTRTHPSTIVETMTYNSNGYLWYISAGGSTRFTVTGRNAREQLTAATYGFALPLTATFGFDNFGYPSSTATGSVQDYRYVFDPLTGNLSSRQNFLYSQSETFTYSPLDCMLSEVGSKTLDMTYNLNGNINTKSDIGTTAYTYGTSGGPYALTSVSSSTGLIPRTDQLATYTSFEKVSTLTEGVYSAAFIYNADNQRAKMDVTQSGSNILSRWYVGSRYMKETAAGVTKEYTYLGGDAYSAPVAAVTQSGTTTYYYLLRDYLGNITHQVNTSNAVIAEYSYNAWGKRRNPTAWWNFSLTGQPELFADRGFTSHEFLKYFNIYNMNGRLYDPLVGRFLSPDNVIQDPTSTQNLNRYSYCLNNPLKYTDPSGYTYLENPRDEEETVRQGGPFYSGDSEVGDWFSAYTNAINHGYQGSASNFSDNYYKQAYSPSYNGTMSFTYYTESRKLDNSVDPDAPGAGTMLGGVSLIRTKHVITINPAGQGGGDYLGTANNWLNGAGYASGGFGAVQIGMLEYRQSLPLMSRIGTFSRFSSSYRLLGTSSKALGGAANWAGAPLTTYLDYSAMQNGEISGARFAYRTTGTVSSIGGGAAIGWGFGGPYGAAGGAIIGAGFVAGEFVYDGVRNAWNLTINQISNFENALKSGWYPGR